MVPTHKDGPTRLAAWPLMLRYGSPGVVFAAAAPLCGWTLPSAWLGLVATLLLIRSRCAGHRTVATALELLLGAAYALASLYLLNIGSTTAEVFATSTLGVAIFATLVRNYRHTQRLLINLTPFVAAIVLMQTTAVALAVRQGQPALAATIIGAPVMVGVMFMALRHDLLSAHRQLTSALIAAETAARTESDFLANMSHEIRTPLNAVIGFADVLERSSDLAPKDRAHVSAISTAGVGLLGVVNDILDWSRLEAGQIRVTTAATDAYAFFQENVALFEPLAAGKGVALRLELSDAMPRRIRFDATRLRQVVSNLLSNAIRFTDVGEVVVRADYLPTGVLTIDVEDTGVGIPLDQRDKLFKRFSQLDRSEARLHGGSGLGLSICRRLARLMDGDVTHASSLSGGSIFRVAITAPITDIAARPDSSQPTLGAPDRGAMQILVVDDLEANRRLMRLLLESDGHCVMEAASGSEALALARDRSFDLILMDLQMPGMDGKSTAGQIRSAAPLNARTAIIAVSAHVLPGHVEASLAAGMDAHLAKPLRAAELFAAVAKWGGVAVDHDASQPARALSA